MNLFILFLLVLLTIGNIRAEEKPKELVVLSAPKQQTGKKDENLITPGDSIFIIALGPTKITSTVKVAEQGGYCVIPFLKNNRLILGYLTIPEAIAQIKGILNEETKQEYVVNVKKLQRHSSTQQLE